MSKKKIPNSSKTDFNKQAKAGIEVEKYSKMQIVWRFSLFDNEYTKELVGKDVEVLKIENFSNKIKDIEQSTLNDIDKATHNDGKSKHHYVSVEKINTKAKDQLKKLKINDTDHLHSLRIDGKYRIFSVRKANIFNIVWIDPYHQVCPSKR